MSSFSIFKPGEEVVRRFLSPFFIIKRFSPCAMPMSATVPIAASSMSGSISMSAWSSPRLWIKSACASLRAIPAPVSSLYG